MTDNPRAFASHLRKAAPIEADGYVKFSAAALKNEDGQIPLKYRELIAISVALTTQCDMCLESHTAAARELGVTEQELAETVFITAALRAGGAYTHGMKAMQELARTKQ